MAAVGLEVVDVDDARGEAGLPATAASSPRFTLMFTDSCGVCMAGVSSDAVRTGETGFTMSSTATPVGSRLRFSVFVGNSSVVS